MSVRMPKHKTISEYLICGESYSNIIYLKMMAETGSFNGDIFVMNESDGN